MSDDTVEIAELQRRLDRLGGGAKPARRPIGKAAGGVVALVLLGSAALYASMQNGSPEPELRTAVPEEFQQGPAWADIEVQPTSAPMPIPAPVPEPDAELRRLVEELRGEVERLRAEAAAPGDGATDERIAALTAEMESLRETSAAELDALRDENASLREETSREIAAREAAAEALRLEIERLQLLADAPVPLIERDPIDYGPTDDEHRRLAELEERRRIERAAQAARVGSPILAYSAGGGAASPVEDRRLSGDEAFVRDGAHPAPVTRAQVVANPGHTVPQGTLVQAAMETAIDSTLPGPVRAIVSEDVHAYDGSRVLIPRGSRLLGRYSSDFGIGQARVLIGWDRIVLPDAQTVEISAYGGDALGRSGTTGDVDSRLSARLGSAILLSIVGAAPRAAAEVAGDGYGLEIAEGAGEGLRDAAGGVLAGSLALGPRIRVSQGARVTVIVDRDLEIF